MKEIPGIPIMTIDDSVIEPFKFKFNFDQEMIPFNVTDTHIDIKLEGPGAPYDVNWVGNWTNNKTYDITYSVEPRLWGGNNEVAVLKVID